MSVWRPTATALPCPGARGNAKPCNYKVMPRWHEPR